MRAWFKKRPKLSIFLAILGGVALILVALAIKPISLSQSFTPDPAETYEEALARIEAIQAEESQIAELSDGCGTRLMTHGGTVENAIVFLHGFTSCPAQFEELGNEYFKKGYNVYIPRQPRHGLGDLTGNPLQGLTAEELAEFGTETADIAQGLGDRVVLAGLSGGGSIAAWLAQERSDIDLAVPIAPFLGIGFIPRPFNRPLTNLIFFIPDMHQWWDPVRKMDNPSSASYSYRGYWLHALFENLRLGFAAKRDAAKVRPGVGSILLITNANDDSVNNAVAADFERVWRDHGEEFLDSFQFARELGIPHDMITFSRPDGRPEIVYPQLLELIQ